ncbi:Gfo/Idh/MocA family protein [Endozoicomonas arenosclerae]|uniref:Gfo/Idh/MocA family protein n=1 Tax=Endozoicomonas arenosclerae TaxID=1633495 RepID=UPI0007861681|nr:Gfo/Idh/MocA family oxidoreductase [Endozoicomonas arenosclerae]
MIRFAVIGTNWISHAFCRAAHETGKLLLQAVYSRQLESAQAFAAEYGVSSCYNNLEAMAESKDIDAVYIASPNAFHAPQAALFLQAGKHVIVEKPIASNVSEVDHLIDLARQNNVVLFEAMKTRYLPNMDVCKKALPNLGKLRKAYFSYCQYSSRYQRYLNGENPNTFNPAFSNGSLMDIGIYPVSAAVELFGAPQSFTANGSLLESGVDAEGSLTLHYEDFEVLIAHSKVSDGHIPSEIQGEQGTLLIDFISECRGVTLMERGHPVKELTESQVENTMEYEAAAFADLIGRREVDHPGLAKTREVSRIITEARETLGVIYPAD